MDDKWYSRSYLGRHFDKFLESEMTLTDFMLLQAELQSVLVQLQESKRFTENGFRNRTGRIHIKPSAEREMY